MNSITLTLEVTVNYTGHRAVKGDGPGAYAGPTPDEPAWVEVHEVELTEQGELDLANYLGEIEL